MTDCAAKGCHRALDAAGHFMCNRHWHLVPKSLRSTIRNRSKSLASALGPLVAATDRAAVEIVAAREGHNWYSVAVTLARLEGEIHVTDLCEALELHGGRGRVKAQALLNQMVDADIVGEPDELGTYFVRPGEGC